MSSGLVSLEVPSLAHQVWSMNTTLSGNEVLALLVKHKVTVPVAFLVDVGIVPPARPKWGMTYLELWQRASLEECIRWKASGLTEQLLLRDGEVMAWSRFTRLHVVRERKGPYGCDPSDVTRETLWNTVEGVKVSLIPEFYLRVPRTHRAMCKVLKTTNQIPTEERP